MKIHLVSRDRLVEKLCREGLAKFCGADWTLYLDPDGRSEQSVDLTILDLESCPGSEEHPWNGTARVLLYSQEQILTMRGPLPTATVLLKPLHREIFLTVLGGAIQAQQSEAAPAGDETDVPRDVAWAGGDASAGGDVPARSDERARSDEQARSERQQQRLLRANVDLQQVYARQMHFLSRGLHDLRAPLTAIEGYSRLLLAERFGPLTAAQRENLRRMQQSIGRLSRMTTDIFQLSVGERGEPEPDLQPGDMARSIRQVLEEMTPLAYSKTIRLVSDVLPTAAVLRFDQTQIHSVLTNLVENACRFTPRNGSIDVRGYPTFWERRRPQVREAVTQEQRWHHSRQPNAYRVDVRDSGLGISDEHLESIFEPYTSYAGSQDRAGSGLGLAICRMVIGAHRGRIFAESSRHGALFSFVLPVLDPAARGERRRPRAEMGPDDQTAGDVAGESA